MAKRRRRRRTATRVAAAPRRRRRRRVHANPGALGRARRNPPTRRARRRRRAAVAASSRRRFRRNPGISASGLVGGIVQGLKDGGAVVVGQVAVRKLRGALTGMMPATMQTQVASPGLANIGLKVASALVVSLVARKAAPAQSRMIAAGAFSEVINAALAATPIAPYLSAYPGGRRALPVQAGNVIPGGRRAALSAWTAPRQVGMSAYPTGGNMRSVGMPVSAGIL